MSVHGRSRRLFICLAAWLHSLTRRFWVRAFEGAMTHDTGCVRLHLHGRIFDRLKHLTRHFFTQNCSLFLRCRTVIFPSKACNSTTRKSILAISVCNCPLFFQLRNHAYMQPRCPHLAVQIDLSRIPVNKGTNSRLGWTKYSDLYETVHPSLVLISLCLFTGA